MDNQINKILQELYEIDPSFKEHEPDLINLVNKILISKPIVKIDKKFAKQLRAELLKKASELSNKKNNNLFGLLVEVVTMRKIAYIAGGAVLAALIIIPVFKNLNKNQTINFLDTTLKITKVGDNAFGSLSIQQHIAPDGRGALDAEVAGFGGGLAAPAQTLKSDTEEIYRIMPPEYETINYEYIYDGDKISIDQAQMEVLKRVKPSNIQGSGFTKQFNLGLANLESFNKVAIQNISFIQNEKYGYIINANLEEGSITIYNNWIMWPQANCQDEKCFQLYQVKINDIPSDDAIIKISNNFLDKFGVNTHNYGQPFIDDNWKISYEISTDKENFYIGNSISVIYPLEINGKKVYEGGGYPVGLNVIVDIKENKVTSITGLNTQDYQSSLYESETDLKKINEWVKRGGIFSYNYSNAKNSYQIKLGDPVMGYFRKWNYQNNQNEELLVPALIFPIIEKSDKIIGYYDKKNVVVPIIKEILNEYEQSYNQPVPRPLPEPIIMEAKVQSPIN